MPTATTNRLRDLKCIWICFVDYLFDESIVEKEGRKFFFFLGVGPQISSKNPKGWLFGLAKSTAYPKGRSNIDTIYFLFQLNFITVLSLMFSNKLQKLTLHMGEGGRKEEGELNKFVISRHSKHSRELKSSSSITSPT